MADVSPTDKNFPSANPSGVSFRQWLKIGAIIVLCCIPFFRSYDSRDVPLGEDEIYWVGQTYYFHLAFEQRDWSHPDWQLLPSRENPVLGKYVIGAGLWLNGLHVTTPDWLGVFYVIAKDRPNAWGTGRDRQERQAVLDRMQPEVRELVVNQDRFEYPVAMAPAARAVMLVFGALAVVAVFILASLYINVVAAFVAALLFALHPAVVAAYTEVGVDILAIAFSLVAVVHFAIIERGVWRGSARPGLYRALITLGGALSLAFAVGSKMNAVVVGFLGLAMCLCFAVAFLRRKSAAAKDSLATMLVTLVIAGVVFVGSSPLNYPNPVRGVWRLYADQQRSLEVQKTIPAKKHPLTTVGERLQAMSDMTALHPALFALVIAAFFLSIVAACRTASSSMIALWWLLAFLIVTPWLPFARPRYALPVIAPSIILICGAGDRLVKRALRKNSTTASPIRD